MNHYNLSKVLFLTLLSMSLLTGCGFKLQGYNDSNQATMNKYTQPVIININKGNETQTAKKIEKALISQLNVQNIPTTTVNQSPLFKQETINVKNIKFEKFQLVGVLTEVSIAISANIIYQTNDRDNAISGTPKIITIQRSYQYNQASVNTNQQQEQELKNRLSELLAQQIADYYIAVTEYDNEKR